MVLKRAVSPALALVVCLAQAAAAAADRTKENPAVKPVPREGAWLERHEQINARAREGNVDLVFIGDSITQGWNDNEVWQKYYGSRQALNAGIGGDRTQHVLWRLDHGNIDGLSPKVAVMMIGTNNSGADQPEQIAEGVQAIVDRLRGKLPETKILLLGIFPRGADADDPRRQTNIAVNEIIRDLDDGQMVHYLDIGPAFLEEDGSLSKEIMPDLLHLSPKGYQIWAESIEPKVAELLGEK